MGPPTPSLSAFFPRADAPGVCVVFFSGVPTMRLRIFEHADFPRRQLDSLQVVVCGGSAVPEELVRKIEAADGYCAITGRLKEMIRRGGMNIYPREIEDVLAKHPAIAESVAFGVPDALWGEQVGVAVRLRPNSTPGIEELQTYLREQISRYKVPTLWSLVDRFPMNSMGKIQKDIVRENFLAASTPVKAGV